MAFTITTKRADGSTRVERKNSRGKTTFDSDNFDALEKYPCNPVSGATAAQAKQNIADMLKETRRNLHDRKGFSKDRNSRLVAKIPQEVFNHVLRNEGREAVKDPKYLIRASQALGIDPRVSRGSY